MFRSEFLEFLNILEIKWGDWRFEFIALSVLDIAAWKQRQQNMSHSESTEDVTEKAWIHANSQLSDFVRYVLECKKQPFNDHNLGHQDIEYNFEINQFPDKKVEYGHKAYNMNVTNMEHTQFSQFLLLYPKVSVTNATMKLFMPKPQKMSAPDWMFGKTGLVNSHLFVFFHLFIFFYFFFVFFVFFFVFFFVSLEQINHSAHRLTS